MVVSHKPDHGRQAALHNDTNYGWREGPDKQGGNPLVGRHVPLGELSKAKLDSIADDALRVKIRQLLAPLLSGKDIKAALREYSQRTGVRRVLLQERLAVIAIHDRRTGQAYRYVKGDSNYCYEIFQKPDGCWDGEVISSFAANQKNYNTSKTHAQNGQPLLMRIHKQDVLAIETEEGMRYMRVAKFSKGQIALVALHEANVDARIRSKTDKLQYFFKSPSRLKACRARPVGVNVLGYVNDPGFHE